MAIWEGSILEGALFADDKRACMPAADFLDKMLNAEKLCFKLTPALLGSQLLWQMGLGTTGKAVGS